LSTWVKLGFKVFEPKGVVVIIIGFKFYRHQIHRKEEQEERKEGGKHWLKESTAFK